MDKIKQIKNRLTLKELAEREGLKLIKVSTFKYKALCPFHPDKTPSLNFSFEKGKYHCFGCPAEGDLINFYAQTHSLTNGEAIGELYNQLFGIGEKRKKIETPSDFLSIGSALEGIKKQIESIEIPPHEVYLALKEYCGDLSSEARAYLNGKKRNLSDETLKHFEIFDIKDYKKAREFLLTNFSLERLKEVGLLTSKNQFLLAKHKIIIPIIEEGKITNLKGRYFDNGSADIPNYLQGRYGKYKNLLNREIAGKLFNGDILKTLPHEETIYLCEGEFDTTALIQNGKKAVGLLGVGNFNEEIVNKLKDFAIVLCFDNDEKGQGQQRADDFEKLFYKMTKRRVKEINLEGYHDTTDYYSAKYPLKSS